MAVRAFREEPTYEEDVFPKERQRKVGQPMNDICRVIRRDASGKSPAPQPPKFDSYSVTATGGRI